MAKSFASLERTIERQMAVRFAKKLKIQNSKILTHKNTYLWETAIFSIRGHLFRI